MADAPGRRLTVAFWEPLPASLVVLVPADAGTPGVVGEPVAGEAGSQVIFTDLPPGQYLLMVFSATEEEQP